MKQLVNQNLIITFHNFLLTMQLCIVNLKLLTNRNSASSIPTTRY